LLTAYRETTVSATVNSSTYSIDLSLSNVFNFTLNSSCTFTFTNPPASGTLQSVTVILTQGGGTKTATFTNAKYTDGVTPSLSTGNGQVDVLTFFTLNGGGTYYGTFAMANVS
jgi:hypothetical protein